VLKPIAGTDPELYANLASFCDQTYPDFEIIFCLHAETDPALPTVKQLIRDFPRCDLKIAIGDTTECANPKIANLAKPSVQPRGELIAIADSDICVGRDYLASLAASFVSDDVGAATCLYAAQPNRTIASRLGALGIEDLFAPSVLVALALGPLRFCLGATMAVRAAVLAQIGGLTALATHLADDHALGELVSAAGKRVELSRYVVATTVPEERVADLWSHELRWARTNRVLAPAGYAFSFLMYAVPLSAIIALVLRSIPACALLLLAILLRYTLHYAARSALGITHRDAAGWVPIRDAISLALWAASFFSRAVRWRDIDGRVTAKGELHR
jgi:ceramide glucosyltransferase